MRTALLIVDIQNDYFPGGKNELAGPIEAAAKAGMLLDAFRERKMPVVHVRHESTRPGATFFLPGTPGAQIHDSVKPLDGETIITKNFPNSFRNTELLSTLKNLEAGRLVICGMMTHMCIDTTVRAAYRSLALKSCWLTTPVPRKTCCSMAREPWRKKSICLF